MLNRERSSQLKTRPLVPALPRTGCVVLDESLSFRPHCLHQAEGGTNLSGRVEVRAPVTAGVGEVVGVQRQQAFRERGAPLGQFGPPGDVCPYLETLLAATTGGSHWRLVDRGQGCH